MISGFRASDIGQYGIEDFSFWPGDLSPFGDMWTFGQGGQSPFDFSLGGVIGSIIGTSFPLPPRANLPPVVISEIPGGITPVLSPQTAGRGTLPQKVNLPTDDEELEELLKERRALEELIRNSPIGTGTLPPIDEEKWGDIIRTPVPVPVDDHEFEDDEMAHTFTHGLGELALGWAGQQLGMGYQAGPGAQTPAQTDAWLAALAADPVNRTAAGCKRRRRQRNILTQSNLNMLFQIATLPNNANVRVALSRAIK